MAKDEMKVGAEAGTKYPPDRPRNFTLHFQQDRKKELVLKTRTVVFQPYGTATVTQEELESPEFQSQRHFFAVTEA